MKSNEYVRPAGIGKSQVAFQTKGRPSLMSADVEQTQDEITGAMISAQSSSTAIARAIAYSSSTSLKQSIQNVCFEMTGASSSFMSNGSLGIDIPWIRNNKTVDSTLYDYSAGTREIIVKKAGWYFVKVFFYAPTVNTGHEWGIRILPNIQLDGLDYEYYPQWMDYQHTSKHPYVNGTAIFNAPATTPNTKDAYPRFKIRLYSSSSNVTFDTLTINANLQIFRLSDLEYSQRGVRTSSPT
jgi:hypothetical protein